MMVRFQLCLGIVENYTPTYNNNFSEIAMFYTSTTIHVMNVDGLVLLNHCSAKMYSPISQ